MGIAPRKKGARVGVSGKSKIDYKSLIDKLRKDLKDAKRKLTVHEEPRSKMAASFRKLMDQPRKKRQVSPHTDPKKKVMPAYTGLKRKS